MSNLRVHGYKHITFWQEDGIGVIALKSDSRGVCNVDVIRELIMAFGTAVADDEVKSVALTGINNNFLTGLSWFEDSQDFAETVDMSHTLVNIIAALKKPVFALLNGNCIDYGYELALLSDYIISDENTVVGFNNGYLFMAGGSATWPRFRFLGTGGAKEGINVDRVIPANADFLTRSKELILSYSDFDFPSIRRNLLSGITTAVLLETDKLLRSFYLKNRQEETGRQAEQK